MLQNNILNLKKKIFLIYGLGTTGRSVIKFFKEQKIKNFFVWDDNTRIRKKIYKGKSYNLKKYLDKVDYIVLSPGVSLKKSKFKEDLLKFKSKIITDIDLLYLFNKKFKSIVVTGTNGKSTTCKIIEHLLKKNRFKVELGGNIGTPVLNLKIKKNNFIVIEASSFQLAYSKFLHPNYAILLNITNDHIDWHGSMKHYVDSKLNIFKLQKKNDFALFNKEFLKLFKSKKFLSKITLVNSKEYISIKQRINNLYLSSNINNENMSYVYRLSKLLKIKKDSFIKSINSFVGLPHRYELFLKRNGTNFVNDSKATSFQASKFALSCSKNIYWILGGLPKVKDKIDLTGIKKNIIKTYIIGKSTGFFKNQLKSKVKLSIEKNLKKAIIQALIDVKLMKKPNCTILLSPSAASFDQFKNFEARGIEFKKLCKKYAKKFI